MSITGESLNPLEEAGKTRRTVFIIAGLVAVLLVAGLIVFLKTRPATQPASLSLDQKLEGGLRAGAPDFEKYRNLIKLDEPQASYSNSVAGGIQMTLATMVRNFTGRTIIGLEMKGSVTDLDGKLMKERTMVVIPGRTADMSAEGTDVVIPGRAIDELENNGTAFLPVSIPGFQGADADKIESMMARVKMEVTAMRFK